MISAELRHFMLKFINEFIRIQVYAVLVIAFCTVVLLFARRWVTNRTKKWNALHEDQIINEFLEFSDGGSCVLMKVAPYSPIRNASLRDCLLRQIVAINGEERLYFCNRYRELGFSDKDLKACKSFDWSLRLEGLLRLAKLNQAHLAPVFDEMRHDKHRIVSASAVYALSLLYDERNQPETDRLHQIMVDGRRNVLLAIVSNWERIHGFAKVFQNCGKSRNMALRNAVYVAAVETKDPAAVPVMIELLESVDHKPMLHLSEEVLAETLKTLLEIGDPQALPVAKRLVNHSSDQVKLAAIEVVIAFGEAIDLNYVQYHTRNASSQVRRRVEIAFHLRSAA